MRIKTGNLWGNFFSNFFFLLFHMVSVSLMTYFHIGFWIKLPFVLVSILLFAVFADMVTTQQEIVIAFENYNEKEKLEDENESE